MDQQAKTPESINPPDGPEILLLVGLLWRELRVLQLQQVCMTEGMLIHKLQGRLENGACPGEHEVQGAGRNEECQPPRLQALIPVQSIVSRDLKGGVLVGHLKLLFFPAGPEAQKADEFLGACVLGLDSILYHEQKAKNDMLFSAEASSEDIKSLVALLTLQPWQELAQQHSGR